jgi:predicted dehydrogenase
MNRRTFMGGAAGALVAARALAQGAAPVNPLPCGVLGLGHAHALDIVKVLRASPDFALAGICEPDEAVRSRYAQEEALQSLAWLTQGELLGDPAIQMVAVESNVTRLLSFGRAVVDAGKHLHMDKPAGTSLTEFRGLLDSAKRQALLVQMGYMFRYNPGFDFVRKMVAEGALGHVHSIHASMSTDLTRQKRDGINIHSGGIMLELGCHLFDMIVLLLGEPKSVAPFIRHDSDIDDTLADNTLAVLEYDRAMAVVECAAREPQAGGGRRFKVAGSEGSITLEPLEPASARLALRNAHGEYKAGVTDIEFPDLERHVLDMAELAASIRGERPFPYSYGHDYTVQRTVLKAAGD